jgi:hypothetical protein
MKQELNKIEQSVVDFLIKNEEGKLKEIFLADLSWAEGENDYEKSRTKVLIDFFTVRSGKRVFEILPDSIKNYVLANSL